MASIPDRISPHAAVDAVFREIAVDGGAGEERVPTAMSRSILDQFDYFDSFPGRAVSLNASQDAFVPPALCYFLFDRLRDRQLDSPITVTVIGDCARNEKEVRPPFRLRSFTMREIVFLGSRSQVERMRQKLMRRTRAAAARFQLPARVEAATDPFFVNLDAPAGRGRALLQRLQGLKHELVIDSGDERVALASFNHHQDFFAKRMNIRLPDGTPAHSGCVAFGLERWAAALDHAS